MGCECPDAERLSRHVVRAVEEVDEALRAAAVPQDGCRQQRCLACRLRRLSRTRPAAGGLACLAWLAWLGRLSAPGACLVCADRPRASPGVPAAAAPSSAEPPAPQMGHAAYARPRSVWLYNGGGGCLALRAACRLSAGFLEYDEFRSAIGEKFLNLGFTPVRRLSHAPRLSSPPPPKSAPADCPQARPHARGWTPCSL